MAITRVLFKPRHAWFRPDRYRYCDDRCGGAILGMSEAKWLGGGGLLHFGGKLLSQDEARRIAVNICQLPELLKTK